MGINFNCLGSTMTVE